MKYELGRLGADGFEKLVQSLIVGIAGNKVQVFGDGPDGQREATIQDANHFIVNKQTGNTDPTEAINAQGYTVVQAKYKSPDGKEQDWSWLKKNLKKELDGFRKKDPSLRPHTYLFFTNIILTPVLNTGIIDKANAFAAEYKDIIPEIHILGQDDILAMLDNNVEVAKTYAAFITPGIVLSEVLDYLTKLQMTSLSVFIEYANTEYKENHAVRWEQAGCSLDKKVDIRKIYTDLEATDSKAKKTIENMAEQIVEWGDYVHRENIFQENKEKKGIPANIMLLGNAGQGKSTLCQYICQLYRYAILQRYKSIPADQDISIPVPKCERFPIMIILKNYAAWLNKQPAESNHSLLSYICYLITVKTGITFTILDLKKLLSGYSWIFLLDGLDEVSASSNKDEVIRWIQMFVDDETSLCDRMVICTSRSQGYNETHFRKLLYHFTLNDMSTDRCRKYIDILLSHIEENSDKREEFRTILYKALDDSITSRLMTTPLYTSIITFMVQMGSTPPNKRYELFHDYCETIIKREASKETLPKVNDTYDWILPLHAQIGFLLQVESDTIENAAAELSESRCKAIITSYLENEEDQKCSQEHSDELYQAITQRLSFLAEVPSDNDHNVLFPLRSIQEYFAAQWMITFSDAKNEQWKKAMEIISLSSYWNNVLLFIAGYIAKDKNHTIANDTLYNICLRNNGNEDYCSDDDIINNYSPKAFQLSCLGSFMALRFLNDNTFSRPIDRNKYLKLIVPLLSFDNYATNAKLHLPDNIMEKAINEYIIPILNQNHSATSVAFQFLWKTALNNNTHALDCLNQIISIIHPSQNRFLIREVFDLELNDYEQFSDDVINTLIGWFERSQPSAYLDFMGFVGHCFHRFPQRQFKVFSYYILEHTFYSPLNHHNISMPEPFEKNMKDLESMQKEYKYTNRGLFFNPINKSKEVISIAKRLKKSFDAIQFDEPSALMQYICSPSRETLIELLKKCKALPSTCQIYFWRFATKTDWLLKHIDNEFGIQGIDSFIHLCDSQYWNDCINKENHILDLINTENFVEIIKSQLCDIVDIMPISDEMIDSALEFIIQAKDKKLITEQFLCQILHAIDVNIHLDDDNSISSAVIAFTLEFLSDLLCNGNGVELVINLFGIVPAGTIINHISKFPANPDISYGIMRNDNISSTRKKLEVLFSIINLKGDYLNAYMFFPYIVSSYSVNLIIRQYIPKLNEETATQLLYEVLEVGNQLAVLGCIMHIWYFSAPKSLEETIKTFIEDLLIKEENVPYIIHRCLPYFCINSLLQIYTITSSHEEPPVKSLNCECHAAILRKMQSLPVNTDKLKALAEEGHCLN